ncbi:hypothetical protein MM300_19390 [Evansella sp. LMS18]|uniref:hypothetical protein n=1 Tax=Evansella sp. LMS18 TaxID=2924033 RepID=UPI0020D02ED2|nr:hypothetical protein [Evansella sp. LMS18]UTR10018.1 hypothetical protein MM300_19390 [Evansella sp. LMS18]
MKGKLLSYPMIAAYGGFTSAVWKSGNGGMLSAVLYGLILGGLFYLVTLFIEKRIASYRKAE